MIQIEGVSMGSVATKLLSHNHFLPIQIAGRKELNDKILIGVDGSDASVRAVDYVAENLGRYNFKVDLTHVIRGFNDTLPENPDLVMSQDKLESAEINMRAHFKQLREKLTSAGFHPQNITEKIITKVYSRAGTIVTEAENGNYSLIVVGRRGHSRVREFFMGRVCQKVVQAGRNHTIWII